MNNNNQVNETERRREQKGKKKEERGLKKAKKGTIGTLKISLSNLPKKTNGGLN